MQWCKICEISGLNHLYGPQILPYVLKSLFKEKYAWNMDQWKKRFSGLHSGKHKTLLESWLYVNNLKSHILGDFETFHVQAYGSNDYDTVDVFPNPHFFLINWIRNRPPLSNCYYFPPKKWILSFFYFLRACEFNVPVCNLKKCL